MNVTVMHDGGLTGSKVELGDASRHFFSKSQLFLGKLIAKLFYNDKNVEYSMYIYIFIISISKTYGHFLCSLHNSLEGRGLGHRQFGGRGLRTHLVLFLQGTEKT